MDSIFWGFMNEINTTRASLIRAKSRGYKKVPVVSTTVKEKNTEVSIVTAAPLAEVIFPELFGGVLSGSGIDNLGAGSFKWKWEEKAPQYDLVSDELNSEPLHNCSRVENDIELLGNAWENRGFKYTVTADSILELEFKSTSVPETSMIVFDTENIHETETPCIQFYGTEAIMDITGNSFKDYDGSGDWVKYKIRLGDYFTGNFSSLDFVNDTVGNSSYRNVIVYESQPQFNLKLLFSPNENTDCDIFSNVIIKTFINGKQKIFDPQKIHLHSASSLQDIEEKEKITSSVVNEAVESKSVLYTEGILSVGGPVAISELQVVLNGDIDAEKIADLDLFSMLDFKKDITNPSVTNWSFKSDLDSFNYLTENESIVLLYKVQPLDDSSSLATYDTVVTILGTDEIPIILSSAMKVSPSSPFFELNLNDSFNSLDSLAIPKVESLNLSLSGPAEQDFLYNLDDHGLFSLDPYQFDYLKEGEQLTIVCMFNLVSSDNLAHVLRSPNAFTLIVEGQKEQSPVVTTVVNLDEASLKGDSSQLQKKELKAPQGLTAGRRLYQFDAKEPYEEDKEIVDSSHESMHELVSEKKEKDFRLITQYNLDEKINLGESLVGEFDCFDTSGE